MFCDDDDFDSRVVKLHNCCCKKDLPCSVKALNFVVDIGLGTEILPA